MYEVYLICTGFKSVTFYPIPKSSHTDLEDHLDTYLRENSKRIIIIFFLNCAREQEVLFCFLKDPKPYINGYSKWLTKAPDQKAGPVFQGIPALGF